MTTTNPTDERSTDDEHPNDTTWRKVTEDLTASIDAGTFSYEFTRATDPDVEDLRAQVEVLPSDAGVVNLEFEVSCEIRGFPARFGAVEALTPAQADDLAVALRSAAQQARTGGADFDLDHRRSTDVTQRIAEVLAPFEVSRDDYGSTEIIVSDTVRTHVYDEGDPATVSIDVDSLDADHFEETGTLTLDADAAAELRADLETAATARVAERRRYDREDE
jgi:hypothetical protein